MDTIELRKIVGNSDIFGKLKNDDKIFFLNIFDILNNNDINKEEFIFHGFECSFVEGSPKLRVLHLEFPGILLNKEMKIKIKKRREKKISEVIRSMGNYFNVEYDVDLCKKIFEFNDGRVNFPIQIGLEYEENKKPKIKIYLSVNSSDFPLSLFFKIMNIDKRAVMKGFLENSKFDAVAVDFMPDKKSSLKLYPLTSRDSGLLVRISETGEIFSKKSWVRFQGGLGQERFLGNSFFNLPLFLQNRIRKDNLKVSYLCLEGKKKSVYFR